MISKKEFKEFYLPPSKPTIVTLPELNYITVSDKSNPNDEDGEYKRALEQLYGVAYTLKMSYKSDYKTEEIFEYVVPPLEGLWWTESGTMDYTNKSDLCFISMIRLPDFITEKDLAWAIQEAKKKKEERPL